jgi:hypothetical protein
LSAQLTFSVGDVVRIGPNELHFSNPQAYHDIYNNKNRWDKEKQLYHSMGEDRSSFGFLTYKESKERKDVMSKMFSPKALAQAHGLIMQKVSLNTNMAPKRIALTWSRIDRCLLRCDRTTETGG